MESISLIEMHSVRKTCPEPRLVRSPRIASAPWLLRIPLFARMVGIYHFRLGRRPDEMEA
jgi:hypothetical protein